MTGRRLSQLQRQILRWLLTDAQRTRGQTDSSHQELVRALPSAKGNISQSLRTLEARGWVVIGRSPGGKAEYVFLTAEGRQRARYLAGSYD
jgi:DNA-binding MarR family transcriptional regulator